jgi:hypothetical protein
MHRVVGRIYVTAVFVLAPLGVYIQHMEERIGYPRSETIVWICVAFSIPLADLVLQLQAAHPAAEKIPR